MTNVLNLYRDAFHGLPRPVWLLSLVLLVNRSGSMVLTFLALYMTQELGFSLSVAGLILSAYGFGHLSGAFLGGWFVDRVGALRIQFLSLLFSGIGFLVLEHLRSLESIAIVVFLSATAAESFRPANGAALAACSPPHLRTRAVALNRMAINLGMAIGPAVGGFLAVYDYSWVFRVDGITCILAALLLNTLVKDVDLDCGCDEETTSELTTRHPFADPAFLGFLVVAVLFASIVLQGWGPYAVYLKEVYGFRESQFGALITLNAILILAFEMILTKWAEKFRPLTMVGIGAFVLGMGFAILPLGRGVIMAITSLVIWTIGEMLCIPFAGGWVANRASVRHRGKYMGMYTMAWGIAFVISPATGSWIYDTLGPSALWATVGAMALFAWVLCELLRIWIERKESIAAGESALAVVGAE